MPRYAISDIHGCHQTFLHLLDQLDFSQADELFLLGDFIDRGPDSYGLIQTIFRLQDTGYRVHCLRGNHEQMMLDALDSEDDATYQRWLRNGGAATVRSIRNRDADRLLRWMDQLPHYLETEDYLFVHAGLDFSAPDPLQNTKALLWERHWHHDIDYRWLGERTIVHGHTPIPRSQIEQMLERLPRRRVLDIDAGCAFTQHQKFGQLCAFHLDARTLTFVDARE